MAQNFFYPPSGGGSSSNASVGPNGVTAPSSSTEVGFISGGNLVGVSSSNPLPVSAGAASDTVASGSLAALNSTVVLATTGAGTAVFNISGTWVGTITFEGSNDSFATSQAIVAIDLSASLPLSATATVNGFYSVLPQGFAKVQARMSAYTSGSATIQAEGSSATRVLVPIQGIAGNLKMTAYANDGSGNALTSTASALDVNIKSSAAGIATAANQATEIASLATIATNSGTQATAANQTTMNSNLITIATNTASGPADLYITGATGTAVINSNLLLAVRGTGSLDLLNYRSLSIQINTDGSATSGVALLFEASDDNVNWVNYYFVDILNQITSPPQTTFNTTISTSRFFEGPLTYRYLRLRANSAISAGNIQAFTKASPATYQAVRANLGTSTAAIGTVQVTSGTISTVTAVTAITNALPPGTANIGLVGTGGSTGVSNAPVQNLYGTTNITTAAYTQLIASTTSATNFLDIFDSSGQAMILATGGAGSEVILAYIPPGGDQIRVQIPGSTRVAYKALSANATTGYLLMNLWK